MKKKTNKKRGDRYMGRGHSRSKGGSRGGCGRAGYKKHKKTLKIFEKRKKNYKKNSYYKAKILISSGLIKTITKILKNQIIINAKRKILDKKKIIEYYKNLNLPIKFNVV